MASPGIKHDFLDPPANGEGDHLGTLGHYRVVGELGKGGMGYVFLAEDTRLKRQVALKVMNQKIASTPGSKKRFISEARAMAAVHHDNVATIFEVGERNGTPFMAMELLEGSTLENYRERRGAPDFHTVIGYARDIARGLAAAHAQGIVHRDIKPANIWLDTKTNRIKILDFGLALAQTPVDQLSGRGAVVGTPGYLSPEQARSEPLDDRSDLYSTGVVLYELATGSLPLKTKAVAEQLIAILAHAPKPLRERNEEIPQPLADLIHKLMAKEPRDRVRNATELASLLDEVEVECEKKTEVAQAINQLQLGLEQAVKKKDGPETATGFETEAASMPNPFESLPDALPAAAPIAGGVSSSGVHAAVPVSAMASGPARPKKPAAPSAGSNTKVIYIAVGVCAAVILLLIPLIVFLSDSSAIARQQGQGVLVLEADDSNDDVSPGPSGSNSASGLGGAKPKAKPRNQTSPKPKNSSKPASPSTLISNVNVKEVQGVAATGAKWILGNNKANGSFEEGEVAPGQLNVPGWTATKSGGDAGFNRRTNAGNREVRTFAYAGKKSELTLVSQPLEHQTKSGDVYRVSMNVGGEGQGKSDYRVVLGFKGNTGPDKRYLLKDVSTDAAWAGGKQAKLRYELAVDNSVAGKRPFVELTISNKNNNRRRSMLDRVSVTVKARNSAGGNVASKPPKQGGSAPLASVSNPDRSTENMTKPTVTSSASPSTPPPGTPSPSGGTRNQGGPKPPTPAEPVREVKITSATEGGADAAVKRGGGMNDPLGERPTLAIQTRNNKQIQHSYIRFPLTSARGEKRQNQNRQGNQKLPPIPVATVELQLTMTSARRQGEATVRVYGLSDTVSDLWPENRIVWNLSLSEKGLDGLRLLAEEKISPNDKVVRVSNDLLTSFIKNATGRSVTFVLTGSKGNELVNFVSKEGSGDPPTLSLGLMD